MFALFWCAAFMGLLFLHYQALPGLVGSALRLAPGATRIPEDAATRYFLVWSGLIAAFTAAAYLTSVAVWGRAAYLGTLFYLSAPLIWLINWLRGMLGEPENSEGFDRALGATLAARGESHELWTSLEGYVV